MSSKPTLLILGGTLEAFELAERLVVEGWEQRFRVLTSLRGSTRNPRVPSGEHRIGGFGGIPGLEAFLQTENVAFVIDATHPFAEQISNHAFLACKGSGIPLIRLERPAWQPELGDDWIMLADLKSAASWLLKHPQRVLLTSGHKGLDVFRGCHDSFFLIRTVEPALLTEAFSPAENLIVRGPFNVEAEIELMRSRSISLVVSKNSGGSSSRPKLLAARKLSISVIMIDRPEKPDVSKTEKIEQVMEWLSN